MAQSPEESGSEENSVENTIYRELSDIPLGELQELRQKVGTKKFDAALKKALHGVKSEDGGGGGEERQRDEMSTFKRANKRRPREMSSKKPVPRYREVVQITRRPDVRDPRFDERAGTLNEDLFKKSYGFLEEMKRKEKKVVQREAKKTKNPERKQQLQRLLQQMESREVAQQKEKEQKALVKEHRKRERELAQQGKKPFYIKKSTQKRLDLTKKFKELKKSGKLEQFLSKKRKKNASRDRKRLPFKRKT